MSDIKIRWDPKGFNLDSLGEKKYQRTTDGDTPYVSISIRMLSIDTPEVHYPNNKKPSLQNENLHQLAEWIQAGKTPISSSGLAQYLQLKLAKGKAGTLQERQGNSATREFKKMLKAKLTKSNGSKRSKRKVFLRAADEHFDQYGRLLAYMAPSYTAEERASMSDKERATFNLLMVESGWAASFPIYPSLPKYSDLVLLQEAAKNAFENRLGAWADMMALTGYEFRMCCKLYDRTKELVEGQELSSESWIERYCLDMTTKEIFPPQDYYKVKPYNRIFVWPDDVDEAKAKLGLVSVG